MKFIGIDLGWRSQPSGLCCLEWSSLDRGSTASDGQLQMLDLDRKTAIADILRVDTWVLPEAPATIAVDAPTLIPNPTGMRLPDRLTHKYFGRYHAGCYPANQSLPFAQRTVGFGLELEARGFAHAPVIAPQQPGRYQIEVFPHPAIVHLFGLERILKYKKGCLKERRLELEKLRTFILDVLPNLEPSLNVLPEAAPAVRPCQLNVPPEAAPAARPCQLNLNQKRQKPEIPLLPFSGAALKAVEDQLDSLICAYVGAHWWYWGLDRNWVLGDLATGYIIVPLTSSIPIELRV